MIENLNTQVKTILRNEEKIVIVKLINNLVILNFDVNLCLKINITAINNSDFLKEYFANVS